MNGGSAVNFSCSIGHSFVILLGGAAVYDYSSAQQAEKEAAPPKDLVEQLLQEETEQKHPDQMQFLYKFDPETRTFSKNPEFDPRFDNVTLLEAVPLSTSMLDGIKEKEELRNEGTQKFFSSL